MDYAIGKLLEENNQLLYAILQELRKDKKEEKKGE